MFWRYFVQPWRAEQWWLPTLARCVEIQTKGGRTTTAFTDFLGLATIKTSSPS